MRFSALRLSLMAASVSLLLAACSNTPRPAPITATPESTTTVESTATAPLRIGLALGGGAAKGFAHIGVIKVLEAHGFTPSIVAGTSAGSVVGALYASGMDAFTMQQQAVSLDEASIRDLQWSAGGLVKGQKLQDYVNVQVHDQPLEKLDKTFVAVATRLEDGKRTVFARGNTGQAVRASSSIPGVFEPVKIGKYHYVDGGVVSPIPVDAVRELGADIVIAVDISDKPTGQKPSNLMSTMNQSLSIMAQKLGQAELAHADVVLQPKVLDIGVADFSQRDRAILEGEKAATAALPLIRDKIAQLQTKQTQHAAQAVQQQAKADQAACQAQRGTLQKMANLAGLGSDCR